MAEILMQEQILHNTAISIGSTLADAHCHLDMFADPNTVINDSVIGGVSLIITAGGSKKSSLEAARIADGKVVFAVIGIDPSNAKEDVDFIVDIKNVLKSNRNIVGIGEIGLDYKIDVEKEIQRKAFKRQIGIAKSFSMPIVIHSRGAIDDVIEIVKESGVNKALFHFFEGNEIQAKTLAEMGNLISLPPQESARRKRIINSLDIRSIVVETDSPVVGKSPLDVIGTIGWIAELKGMEFKDAASAITENVKKLFSI